MNDPSTYFVPQGFNEEYRARKALVKSYLGKIVDIEMDRPIGTVHPKHPDMIYPINYGYIPGVIGGDGEELDVYLLGVDIPITACRVRIIAIIHRHDDEEDKLVAVPADMSAGEVQYTATDIAAAVHFQEQFYHSYVEVLS